MLKSTKKNTTSFTIHPTIIEIKKPQRYDIHIDEVLICTGGESTKHTNLILSKAINYIEKLF